jgi:hypothetical protein
MTDPDEIAALPLANRPRPATSRALRVESIRNGKPSGWRHGTFAILSNSPDVMTEHALILAAHPGLDPVQDHRLVEDLALARVQRNRALIAMEDDPKSSILTSYASRLFALIERGERTIRERERERVRTYAARPTIDVTRYRELPRDDDE